MEKQRTVDWLNISEIVNWISSEQQQHWGLWWKYINACLAVEDELLLLKIDLFHLPHGELGGGLRFKVPVGNSRNLVWAITLKWLESKAAFIHVGPSTVCSLTFAGTIFTSWYSEAWWLRWLVLGQKRIRSLRAQGQDYGH